MAFGPFCYFNKRLWKKGLMLIGIVVVSHLTTLERAAVAVVESGLQLPLETFTATTNIDGKAVPASPEQQADSIIRLFFTITLGVVLWKLFKPVWKRTLLLLAFGLIANAIAFGLATLALWVSAAVLANYDYYLLIAKRRDW